ncbi:hypothetical protein [Streptomyces sp. NBC_00620]|uniref:hypothetical protein n=1 Tax=Streptomyces sp. NBC_00620 TaxID=2903666 RepID=UPI00224F9D5D|nr:hypothetical protein [Streptomyces sp. NBC_00620]MCX4976251.1 hypothetical protein [Streptomyces sp. NBC_00620]
MQSQEELLNACKAFVTARTGLDVRTCRATSGGAWLTLAARLMASDEQARRTRTTAQRLRRYHAPVRAAREAAAA